MMFYHLYLFVYRLCFKTSGVFCLANMVIFLKDFIFIILGIIRNHCYQDSLQHLLLTVILYGYKIFLLQEFEALPSILSPEGCGLLLRKESGLESEICCKMSENTSESLWGFFLFTKGSKNWLPHNFASSCYLYFALAVYCIYYSDFQMQQHLKEAI